MSRHRNVRSMNYQDEYDGYDDVYGHSVEDDYCVSPGTAAQFLYDRNNVHPLESYLGGEEIPEEDETEVQSEHESLHDSSSFTKPALSDVEQAQLNSCLEELRNIVGEVTPEHILVSACMQAKYDVEIAVDAILSQQDAPKPQRKPRERKYRDDLIKERQKGAFTRTGERKRGGNDSGEPPPAQSSSGTVNEAVKFTIGAESADTETAPVQPVITGTTRMTFSSGKQTVSGFTPEKDGQQKADAAAGEPNGTGSAVEKVKKNLKMDSFGAEGPSSAEAQTPSKSSSKSDAFGRNVSSSDLGALTRSASKLKLDKDALQQEFEKRKEGGKEHINLVVIGHVDAGKSTMMGHVLYQLGFVNKRTMHKYEQESKKLGKASFAYAWVLDETEEERSRGVTMDVAQTRFETDNKIVTLLDAPGHKDFIPNMITGAAQADVAVLVVNSTRGEFETGFDAGGQTREHAMLIRSLGVSQLVVAVNKMDTVDWSKTRFDEITRKLGHFLKQAGFRESDVKFIPCSGLNGDNLVKTPIIEELTSWYTGPTLVQQIDKFEPPERPIEKPFRMCVTDVFKGIGAGYSVSGTMQAGCVQMGERLHIMPQGGVANVKSITIDDLSMQCAFAGDSVILTLTGIDLTEISVGSILCDPSSPIKSSSRLKARVVIFNIDLPITKGFPVVFHYQSLSEAAHVRKLVNQLNKSTGQVIRSKPRCLTKNTSAIIELELDRSICIELYKDFKDLGRFMLRYGGSTIAAGVVTEIVNKKA